MKTGKTYYIKNYNFHEILTCLIHGYKNIGQNNPYIIKEQAFGGGACVCHGHFWGRSLCLCQHRLLPQN